MFTNFLYALMNERKAAVKSKYLLGHPIGNVLSGEFQLQNIICFDKLRRTNRYQRYTVNRILKSLSTNHLRAKR